MQQVQSAAGLDSPEALHQLGQLFRAGLQQPHQVDGRQLAGLRRHLKPLGGLPAAELDALEAALPGAPPRPWHLLSRAMLVGVVGGGRVG